MTCETREVENAVTMRKMSKRKRTRFVRRHLK